MQYYKIHHIDFKSTLEIYFLEIYFLERPRLYFFLPIMPWRPFHYECIFGPFNENPHGLKKFEKFSSQQLLLQVLLLLRLLLKFRM